MKLSCRTIHELRCELCEQNVSSEEANDERILIRLVGHTSYAQCPACKRSTENFCKDAEWQRKVRVWIFTHHNQVVKV
jgi:hypothetical protein